MDPTVTFPANWTAPRELARALPRDTRISGRGIGVMVMAVAMLAGSIPAFLLVRDQDVKQMALNQRLRTEGREARGEISRLWHKDRGNTPMVGYAFGANGVWIHGEAEVPQKYWAGIQKAGFMPVRYLPSNPTVNHPAAWEEPVPPLVVALLFPLVLVGCGAFLLFTLKRQATLLAEGLPAVGVITRCFRVKRRYRVRYQFRTKEGVVTKGSDKLTRRVDSGATVCVLYLPDKPSRSGVYPLCFYRVNS